MPDPRPIALRVARLALILSLLLWLGCVAAVAAGAGEWAFLVGLVASGWIALSALACLVLQVVQLIRWRRGRRDG